MAPMSERFDVFLSYNRRDHTAARDVARALRARGLRVWLDEWELVPGRPWQEALERAIQDAASAAILVGGEGLGRWEEPEMRVCLDEAVRRKAPVIPVLLPGAPRELKLPPFLARHKEVDLRDGVDEEGIGRLVWGVTGEKRPAPRPDAPLPGDDDVVAAYRDWARTQHRGLSLVGVGGGEVQMRLEEVFVPLSISQRSFELDLDERGERRRGDAALAHGLRELDAEEIFSAPAAPARHVVVFGDPGAGKTTVLRKLHHQCLTAGPVSLGLDAGTLPVFLRLRRFDEDDLGRPFGEILDAQLATLSDGRLPKRTGTRLWRRGRLLLLLDGLDETADDTLRAGLCRHLEGCLRDAAEGVRMVVSCRYTGWGGEVGLDEDFLPLDIRPLDAERCRQLVRLWFREVPRALPRYPEREAREAGERLVRALDGPDYGAQRLKVLVGSPLLLTLLCVVVVRGGEMPRQRVAFYDQCLRVLLSQWGRSRASDDESWEPPLDVETAFALLRPLAWELHGRPRRDDLLLTRLHLRVEERLEELDVRDASPFEVVRWLHREAGILDEFAPRRFGFVHLGVQEYLAALHAASRGEELLEELCGHLVDESWHEVLLLLAGLPGRRLFAPLMEQLLRSPALLERADLVRACLDEAPEVDLDPFFGCLRDEQEPARQAAVLRLLRGRQDPRLKAAAERLAASADPGVAALARQMIDEADAAPAEGATSYDVLLVHHPADAAAAAELREKLRRRGSRVAATGEGWQDRLEDVLGSTRRLAVAVGRERPWDDDELGDLLALFARRGAVLVPVRLPDGGPVDSLPDGFAWEPWVELGAGFTGVERLEQAGAPSAPVVSVRGEAVTGTRFLRIPGGRFQMGSTVWKHTQPVHEVRVSPFRLAETPVTNRQYAVFLRETGHTEPKYWRDRRFSADEQPVVGVSWHDARAFCAWLAEASGLAVTLPTEAQWEFAARGEESREYPWGDAEPDDSRACYDQGWTKGQPAAVGSRAAGRGPYGTLDQAGNVWEWCLDAFDDSVYASRAEAREVVDPFKEAPEDEDVVRVLRGGAWFLPADYLRAAYRVGLTASLRDDVAGFRLCAAPLGL